MSNLRKQIHLNGEEALAHGAIAAGVHLVAGYPGSPGIDAMNSLIEHARENTDLYVEWSVNERVALEVCIGASMAGRRSLVCTKSVGMNVLLDPLMTLNLTGTHGGMVILLGDDPGAYGSQNEQDTRLMASLIEIPMLEPASPSEAYQMMREAFDLSERFKTAIVVRITRAFAQQVEDFNLEDSPKPTIPLNISRQPYRFVPYPGNAVALHRQLHQRLADFESKMEEAKWDQISGKGKKGVIAAGLAYQKLRNVVGDSLDENLSILKLSTLYPLPKKIIGSFLEACEEVLVLEESDAYVEAGLKTIAYDLNVRTKIFGKKSGHLPVGDELLRWQIQAAMERFLPGFQPARSYLQANQTEERPPKINHCVASPNEHILALIKNAAAELDQNPILIADPGCWVKVAGELDGKFAIGSAVAVASGLDKSGVDERVVALFGDSAFFHMTLPAICNAASHRSNLFMLLLNNGGAMSTGKQPTPASGVDTLGAPAPSLNIIEIAQACGVTNTHHLSAGASDDEIKDLLKAGLSDRNLFLLVLDVE